MKVLIIDWFNILKRYTQQQALEELDYGDLIDTVTFMLLNKICDVSKELFPDLIVICSDSGYNRRAQSVVDGYKANRIRPKSASKEEKEKNYEEFIKNVAKTLPCPFLEVRNTEADMIIRCVIHYMHRIDKNIQVTIASSDSDFIQLLNEKVKIYDWYKGLVTEENWYIKNKKHDGQYLNIKNYAIAKAVTGDKSDNVIGINSWGWKKVTRIFSIINTYYKADIVVDNFTQLITYIDEIINDPKDTDKKDINLLNKIVVILKENKDMLTNNMSIIDLNSIETPYLYEIYTEIEKQFYENKMFFNKNKLLEYMQLGRYGSGDPEQYKKLIDRNSKAAYAFYNLTLKANSALSYLQRNKK